VLASLFIVEEAAMSPFGYFGSLPALAAAFAPQMPLKDLVDVCTVSIAMAAWPEVQPVGDVPGMTMV
jgi:hypothetical protein